MKPAWSRPQEQQNLLRRNRGVQPGPGHAGCPAAAAERAPARTRGTPLRGRSVPQRKACMLTATPPAPHPLPLHKQPHKPTTPKAQYPTHTTLRPPTSRVAAFVTAAALLPAARASCRAHERSQHFPRSARCGRWSPCYVKGDNPRPEGAAPTCMCRRVLVAEMPVHMHAWGPGMPLPCLTWQAYNCRSEYLGVVDNK